MITQLKEFLFRLWYWYISKVDKKAEIIFMNYGYHHPNQQVDLHPDDEANRYSIQLYHLMASSINLKDKALLEIGCGRGGGLYYVARHFPVSSASGLDLNKKASQFSAKHYKKDGLHFIHGDAQKLNFEDESFDVILNVESSHRYQDMRAFLNEVYRVLRPGGHFLFTDFRFNHEMAELHEQLSKLGLQIIENQNITKNVVSALERDDQRRRILVKKFAPRILRKIAHNFAGVIGSPTYQLFVDEKYQYFSYVLKKQQYA